MKSACLLAFSLLPASAATLAAEGETVLPPVSQDVLPGGAGEAIAAPSAAWAGHGPLQPFIDYPGYTPGFSSYQGLGFQGVCCECVSPCAAKVWAGYSRELWPPTQGHGIAFRSPRRTGPFAARSGAGGKGLEVGAVQPKP